MQMKLRKNTKVFQQYMLNAFSIMEAFKILLEETLNISALDQLFLDFSIT